MMAESLHRQPWRRNVLVGVSSVVSIFIIHLQAYKFYNCVASKSRSYSGIMRERERERENIFFKKGKTTSAGTDYSLYHCG